MASRSGFSSQPGHCPRAHRQDELDRIYPVPPDQEALNEANLSAVWQGFASRGGDRLVVMGVFLDRPSEVAWLQRTIPAARFTFVRLRTSWPVLPRRVRRREVGAGVDAQLERTRRQLEALERVDRPDVLVLDVDAMTVSAAASRIIDPWLDDIRSDASRR